MPITTFPVFGSGEGEQRQPIITNVLIQATGPASFFTVTPVAPKYGFIRVEPKINPDTPQSIPSQPTAGGFFYNIGGTVFIHIDTPSYMTLTASFVQNSVQFELTPIGVAQINARVLAVVYY